MVYQNETLNAVFEQIHDQHFPRGRRRVEARFHPYRTLRHTVQWNAGSISARVSYHYQKAPRHILEILALILLSRVYRRPVDRTLRKIYRSFSHDLQNQLPLSATRSTDRYQGTGKHYDLQAIFDELNIHYFQNSITAPSIGWSQRRSFRRLGFYDARRNLLVISRIFDNPGVPAGVVKYLVYHEMLHIVIPDQPGRYRRILHPPEFRRLERRFPEFHFAEKWLKQNLNKLLFN